MKFPLLARAAAIAAVAAAILFPLALVSGKIGERQRRASDAENAFARETSGPQTVVGPLLALACEETVIVERVVKRGGKDDTIQESKTRACPTTYFPPRTLEIAGEVPVESRYRGIYPIRLYRAALGFSGEFAWPPPPSQEGALSRAWTRASVVVATGDARGIKSVSSLGWGTGDIAFTSGRPADASHFPPEAPRGDDTAVRAASPVPTRSFSLEAPLGDYVTVRAASPIPFRFSLELSGTRSLMLAPVGDTTKIRLASGWPHPSFVGAFAPDERTVGPQGFKATWKTTHFATGGQSAWQPVVQKTGAIRWENTTGFSLADPVNIYSLSYRATEYGFLFVLFTFAGLALAEVTAGIRLHPVQYALVGSALAVFFLLLIALAEHIAFAPAYGVAATACVVLLVAYLRAPLGTWGRTGVFLGLFVTLYGTLYGLLQSEDHALLAGSILVFAVLATGMLATRRVDWGALARGLREEPAGNSVQRTAASGL